MKFGPVPLRDALGGILAHSQALADGRLRKGLTLGEAEIARLAAAGVAEVVVARLDPTDIDEDAAAERIGRALVHDEAAQGLRLSRAATGRINLHATVPGILDFDPAAVVRLNMVDPMITFACLPHLARLEPGVMAGTVKIIPYGVPRTAVARAAATGAALRVRRAVIAGATLIETEAAAGSQEGGSEKGEAAIRARLERLGVRLDEVVRVPHRTEALTAAIQTAKGGLILILTASATSDANDVGPEALRRAGGRVIRVGLPVDPGNLLFLAALGNRPVIGMPGCARSLAPNGADLVLERVVCGVTLTDADIAALAVGGLLKETKARGRPREA
jgi:molybdenum cofactor cytidylyltransferase